MKQKLNKSAMLSTKRGILITFIFLKIICFAQNSTCSGISGPYPTNNMVNLPIPGRVPINNCQCVWMPAASKPKYFDPMLNRTITNQTLRYTITYGNNNGITHTKLRKPILVIGGFDPFYTYSCEDIKRRLGPRDSIQNILLNQGYDIVAVYWSNSILPIQANAYLLADFLEDYINNPANKEGNEQNIIIAESMGGLISRYCLAYMEANNRTHNVRLYASVDAPHRGANAPISFQSFSWYMRNRDDITVAAALLPDLNKLLLSLEIMELAPSTRQMLLYNFSTGKPRGGLTQINPSLTQTFIEMDPYHSNFYTELKTLNGNGYPNKCKNIAASLGSFNGGAQLRANDTPAQAGDLAYTFDLVIGNLAYMGSSEFRLMPDNSSGGRLVYKPFLDFKDSIYFKVNPMKNIDAAPGGYFLWFDILEQGLSQFEGTIKSKPIARTSFIPTVSALDYNTDNLFFNFTNNGYGKTVSETPFDDIWWKTGADNINTDHVAPNFPPNMMNWLMNHINSTNRSCKVNQITYSDKNLEGNTLFSVNGAKQIAVNNIVLNAPASFSIIASSSINFKNTIIKAGSTFNAKILPCDYNTSKSTNHNNITPVVNGNSSLCYCSNEFYTLGNSNLFNSPQLFRWDGFNQSGYGSFSNFNIGINQQAKNHIIEAKYFGNIPNIYGLTGNKTVTLFAPNTSQCPFPVISCLQFREEKKDTIQVIKKTFANDSLNINITITPNPTTSKVHLTTGFEGESEIVLTDIAGKTLQTFTTTSNETDIDLSSYSNGMYFFKITNRLGKHIAKVMKIVDN